MKKINVLVLGALIAMGLSSCIKGGDPYDPTAQYEIEKPLIEEYVMLNFPGATFHEATGIWYQILQPGTPGSYEYKFTNEQIEVPVVTVKYKGKLLNGVQFDENQTDAGLKISLGRVIQAWQIAFLPREIDGEDVAGLTYEGLQKGAKIRIVTPSLWGYRNQKHQDIPPNSPLEFEIEVLDITPPSGTGN